LEQAQRAVLFHDSVVSEFLGSEYLSPITAIELDAGFIEKICLKIESKRPLHRRESGALLRDSVVGFICYNQTTFQNLKEEDSEVFSIEIKVGKML
jgi:hypothetical protein